MSVQSSRSRDHGIRFTVADASGSISFIGPCHAIKMLVAGCARGASTHGALLRALRDYDELLADQVLSGLRVFDEHNLPGDTTAIEHMLETLPPLDWPPFRVLNHITRNASTQPAGAGLIIFNLEARRIIQVQNSYAEIQRRDRGRYRKAGKPIQSFYYYELPRDWALVP